MSLFLIYSPENDSSAKGLGICNIKPGTCYSAKMCEVLKKKKKEKLNGDIKRTQEPMERIPNG